jgi:hypothetical protein
MELSIGFNDDGAVIVIFRGGKMHCRQRLRAGVTAGKFILQREYYFEA